jgi:hypothetical protein
MTGMGEFIYRADRYVGTMQVTMARGDQPVTVTMPSSASRLGDCVTSGRSSAAAGWTTTARSGTVIWSFSHESQPVAVALIEVNMFCAPCAVGVDDPVRRRREASS